jgi:hypothetical protein
MTDMPISDVNVCISLKVSVVCCCSRFHHFDLPANTFPPLVSSIFSTLSPSLPTLSLSHPINALLT